MTRKEGRVVKLSKSVLRLLERHNDEIQGALDFHNCVTSCQRVPVPQSQETDLGRTSTH